MNTRAEGDRSGHSDTPRPRRSRVVRGLLLGVAVVGALVAVGGGYWALTCPCDGTPGFVLLGDVDRQPVTDWTFANDVDLCQIQISIGWRPHSVNLNCMATPNGELYLSCSVGANKYWCPRVGEDHPGRLRLDGTVYPVVLNRVSDPATLDEAWRARVAKLQGPDVLARQPSGATAPPLDAERPDHWWSFHVQTRTPGRS
jgi:hypothetical protein